MEFDAIMEVEDSLQLAGVFLNPFTGRACHSDSYGTIVQYDKLEAWYAAQQFQQLPGCVEYWRDNPNVGPSLKQVASFVAQRAA